ncbi:unnamed protein product [Rhizophagus irregularis]|uniref:Uncharacterized protein n=1 Tax=Rhizophagus irregularis TaxID=588596 RepID=A0A915ZI09_9GLOM|nr:unnamed protein product [Rhizophagus irregularis]CAB5378026.1 unnamed protein product [Rhizophagus irregularis]
MFFFNKLQSTITERKWINKKIHLYNVKFVLSFQVHGLIYFKRKNLKITSVISTPFILSASFTPSTLSVFSASSVIFIPFISPSDLSSPATLFNKVLLK